MIDRIGFWSYTGYQIAYLSTNWSLYFSSATAHGVLNAYHVFLLYLAKLHCKVDLVQAEAMQTCPGFFLKSLLDS